jgi:hypothetical protein
MLVHKREYKKPDKETLKKSLQKSSTESLRKMVQKDLSVMPIGIMRKRVFM